MDGRDESARDEFLRDLDEPAGPSPETLAAIEGYKRAMEAADGSA